MNEIEAHRVKRDLQLSTLFAYVSGCSGCIGAYMSKDGWNLMAHFSFLLSVIAIIITIMVGSRGPEEVTRND